MMAQVTATYAYFPGTGPAGKTCSSCVYLKQKHSARGSVMKGKFFCDKARQFIDKTGETLPIAAYMAACKYYDTPPEKEPTR